MPLVLLWKIIFSHFDGCLRFSHWIELSWAKKWYNIWINDCFISTQKREEQLFKLFKRMSFNKLLISMHSWISCVAMTSRKMRPRRKNNLTSANGLLFSFLLVVVYLNAKWKKKLKFLKKIRAKNSDQELWRMRSL